MPNIFELGMNKWMQKEAIISNPQGQFLEGISQGGGGIISGGVVPSTTQVNPNTIQSGEMGSILAFAKKNFSDTTEGWIQGIDTDGKYKWLIGGADNYIDWSVTTASVLTIKGTLVSSSIIAGEIHIPDENTTANSFHVETDGDTWWGCTHTNFTANNDNATAYILKTGVAKLSDTSIKGSLDISTSGNIKSGQTAYNTGTGWFWEYNAGTPRASIGTSAGNYLTWDGSALTVKGVIIATTATIASTTTDTFTINSDLDNVNVDLVFGRTTGGNATLRYDGSTVNIDKSFTVSGTAVVLTSRTLTAGAGLTGGGDLSADRTFTVGAGDGITVNADDVALTTPGTLTVSTLNSSSGNHTHAITSSSNPGATASILASDASGYLTLVKLATDTISDKSGGNLTISPAGDIIFDPTGNDLLPNTGYDLNIGSLGKKYLTLHAAELWVETLVAQNTIATIGGRILVGPTTTLTRDLTDVATTIYVKHNEMASGDRVYMEANAKVEFMAITSAPTLEAEGDYSYTVTRNLDGTGANVWNAGDAMFNTGTTGDGFIDIYSVAGVKAGTEFGPAIAGNVRNSATYNDWSTHWAIGNLNGLYGYGVTTYGVAFGEYAVSKTHITIDSTNGYRIFNGTATVIGQWDTSGNITVGQVGAGLANTYISAGALDIRLNTTSVFGVDTSGNVRVGLAANENVYITSTAIQFKDGSSVYTDLTAGVLTLGLVSGGEYLTIDGTNGINLYGGATKKISLKNDGTGFFAGALTVGDGATTSGSIALNHFATGGDTYISGGTITIADWTAQNGFIIGIDDSDSDKFKAYFGNSTTDYQWDWNVTTADTLTVNGSTVANQDIYGDGSDGDVTISGDTTLTSDMYYNNLTIDNGFTLTTSGYRIFVKGTLTNAGTISNAGVAGTAGGIGADGTLISGGIRGVGGAGGASGASAFFSAGVAGSNSGDGGSGSLGNNDATSAPLAGAANGSVVGGNLTVALGSNGKAGVTGGDGGRSENSAQKGAGGTGANGGTVTPASLTPKTTTELVLMRDFYVTTPVKMTTSAGSGGSGGGGGGRGHDGGTGAIGGGGGGGAGGAGGAGGILFIASRKIVNTGTITVKGGNGGAGGNGGNARVTTGNSYAGGGGGGASGSGGNGGVLVYIYSLLTNSGTISVAGGTAGTAGTGGAKTPGATTATDGVTGATGNNGDSGLLISLQV